MSSEIAWRFDKSIRLMTRRQMRGVHTVLGKTMFVKIDVRLLNPQELKQLAGRLD
jgi:hypothetical protein